MFFGLFGQKKITGLIGYFGLSDWWLTSFSKDERKTIKQLYKPLGGAHLDDKKITYSGQNALSFLYGLAGWFSKNEVRPIGYKILDEAEKHITEAKTPLDLHFFYQTQIELYYRDREKPDYMNRVIQACHNQIAIAQKATKTFRSGKEGLDSLPSHKGYEQLAIILERKRNYQETICLCERAKKQGWAGKWDDRITRCLNSMKKA